MPTGVVKKVVPHKGFGFLRPEEGGEELFFHQSTIVDRTIADVERGDHVEYRLAAELGANGKPQVIWLKVLEKVAEALTTEFRQVPRHRKALRKKPSWRKP